VQWSKLSSTKTRHFDSKSVHGPIDVRNFVTESSRDFVMIQPDLQHILGGWGINSVSMGF
jgi:hypothetical protein